MSNRVPWRSSVTFRLKGPVDEDGTVLTSGSCTGKIFDPSAENRAAAAAASGDSILSLRFEPEFLVGDTLRIARNDGTFLEAAVTAVDHAAKTVTISGTLGVAVVRGAIVERKIGADFAVGTYNASAAVAGTYDWGWRGSVAPSQAGIVIDHAYVVELTLVSGGYTVVDREIYEFTDAA